MFVILFPYLFISAIVLGALFVYWLNIKIANARRIAPPVYSGAGLRRAVANAIALEIPNAKTIVDIGAGWGGMARHIARRFPRAQVLGLEIMPMPYIYSRVRGVLFRNAKFYLGDAFGYLKNKKFDVGITYLLPVEMESVRRLMSQFRILLVLDFPLPDVKPSKKIKLHYGVVLGQHWLYVYKNRA